MNPFIGEILIMANNFVPSGTAYCNGQVMPIQQYTALFSLYGTTYGGNGTTSFGLPDLVSRVPLGSGTPPGHGEYRLGQPGGTQSVTLVESQMPSHSHAVQCNTSPGSSSDPDGRFPAGGPSGRVRSIPLFNPAPGNGQMAPNAVHPAGGTQAHNNVQPYLALGFCCALDGVYPMWD